MNKGLSIIIILLALAGWVLYARQGAELKELREEYEVTLRFAATSFAGSSFFQGDYFLLPGEGADGEPLTVDGKPVEVRAPGQDYGLTPTFVAEFNREMRRMIRKTERMRTQASPAGSTDAP